MFVTSNLGPGGAERVLSTLADATAEHGHDVSLVTLADSSHDFYVTRPGVSRIGLSEESNSRGMLEAVHSNWRRVNKLRAEMQRFRPHAVISFLTRVNVISILAARGAPWRVIVSERTDPRYSPDGPFWSLMRRLTYPFADVVVAQTTSVATWLSGWMPPNSRIEVIANPVVPVRQPIGVPGLPERFIVTVARLTPEKGIDRLLKSFVLARALDKSLELVIVGEGRERASLQTLASKLGIEPVVHWLGQVSNPLGIIAAAQALALTSRYEGFPNVLLEALSVGTPVVAMRYQSGPDEIIEHGVNGFIVENGDIAGFGMAVSRLTLNPQLRSQFSNSASRVQSRFALTAIVDRWITVAAGASQK